TGREVVPPLMHDGRPGDAVWSPDGKSILTTADANGVRAWDSATGKVTVSFPHSNSVSAIAISPDGSRFATAHQDKTVRIWETLTARQVGPPLTDLREIRELAFSPDSRRLAISTSGHGTEGIVEVRDVASGELVGRPAVHRDSVVSFEFSRDGQWLA